MLAPPRVGQRVAGCKPTASCLFQILDRRSSAGVSSHGTILRDKEIMALTRKEKVWFQAEKTPGGNYGKLMTRQMQILGQIMVYGSSLSPWEARAPFFLPQAIGSDLMLLEVFQLHFPWQQLLRVCVHGEPNILKKNWPSTRETQLFGPAATENNEKLGTNRWMAPKNIVPFQFLTGKVLLQLFFYHASTCQCCLASSRNLS